MKPMKEWRNGTYSETIRKWNPANQQWSRNETTAAPPPPPSHELPDPSFRLSCINNNFAGAEHVSRYRSYCYTFTFGANSKIMSQAAWDPRKLNKLYVFNFHFEYYMNLAKNESNGYNIIRFVLPSAISHNIYSEQQQRQLSIEQ